MPNWCSNKLMVRGPEAGVDRFKAQATGHSPWLPAGVEPNVLNFHGLLPIPPDILSAGYEQAGYDWERTHWGCKWGACEAQVVDEWEGCLHYAFETAWSPPIPLLSAIALQWPTLTFILDYEELSMGFKGLARFSGDAVDDHCIEI
jgi:hypothetical protein